MGLGFGEAAPYFAGDTAANPRFQFSSVAGRFVLLGFAPPNGAAVALDVFQRRRPRFDDINLVCFIVAVDQATIAQALDDTPGLRWFRDPSGAIAEAYGEASDSGRWLLLAA
ncbi:MAG: 2OG-Fe(II) oxygenase, partial [Phenylobacterium sp.]|nr:2OG-Fe(II) oxygenase [Phenylobacterium sp.]